MDKKLENTVEKTIIAIERIGRFVKKYGNQLDEKSIEVISAKIIELKNTVDKIQ